jgi:hypothetical protein
MKIYQSRAAVRDLQRNVADAADLTGAECGQPARARTTNRNAGPSVVAARAPISARDAIITGIRLASDFG